MASATPPRQLYLGNYCSLEEKAVLKPYHLPAHHLTTHGFISGMTNTGKTGAGFCVVEEALRQQVPVLMIDIKGDLPNFALAFSSFAASHFEPWVEPPPGDERTAVELAQAKAAERQQCLQTWGLGEPDLKLFATGVDVRIITPGSDAGEPLHVLSSLAHAHEHWQRDPTATRASLSAAISLVLRLVGLDPDPAKSRQHVF